MADIVQLPTSAAEPLPKKRWHGSYPKGVSPISRQRIKRQSEEFHRAAEERREQARSSESVTRNQGIDLDAWWAGLTDFQRSFVYVYARHALDAVGRTD